MCRKVLRLSFCSLGTTACFFLIHTGVLRLASIDFHCKMLARPAMMYGLWTAALSKRQEAHLEELKILKLSLGMTRMDRIRNHYNKGQIRLSRLERK